MNLAGPCLSMLRDIVDFCLDVWMAILNATGLGYWWTASVILVVVFSIVFVPMRGGQLLGGGAIASFATTKINKRLRKSQSYHHEDD